MSRKAIAVAVLSALAIAASGCSGGSESEVEKFPNSFKDRYGNADNAATWYRHVTGTSMRDDGFFMITTNLGPETEEGSETIGKVICRAASTLALNLGQLGDGIKGVFVIGADGGSVVGCA